MRRTIPATLALSLILGATPVLAQDDEPQTEAGPTQRIDVPALGFAMDVPADWSVLEVSGERESAVDRDDGTPVMETTAFYASGGEGTWCDVDAYLDLSDESGLDAFAFALVTFMQETEGPDVAMMVDDEELPIGPAFRIEAFNQATGHIRGLYLFDGPAGPDGLFERYLLTCSAREFGEPFWTDIARSTEFSEPASDDAMAAEDMADDSEEAPAEEG